MQGETFGSWLRGRRKAEGYEALSDFHAALDAWCRENGRTPPASRQSCWAWERAGGGASVEAGNLLADFLGLDDAERGRMFALMSEGANA